MPGMQLKKHVLLKALTQHCEASCLFFFHFLFQFHLTIHWTNTYWGAYDVALSRHWGYSLCHHADLMYKYQFHLQSFFFVFCLLFFFSPQEIINYSEDKDYILYTFESSTECSILSSKTVGLKNLSTQWMITWLN